jgi:hypothetical protein
MLNHALDNAVVVIDVMTNREKTQVFDCAPAVASIRMTSKSGSPGG